MENTLSISENARDLLASKSNFILSGEDNLHRRVRSQLTHMKVRYGWQLLLRETFDVLRGKDLEPVEVRSFESGFREVLKGLCKEGVGGSGQYYGSAYLFQSVQGLEIDPNRLYDWLTSNIDSNLSCMEFNEVMSEKVTNFPHQPSPMMTL